jgi:MoxR-like ATPase
MVEQVIASGQFFPIYITGPSGNGKTFQVEQACAKLGREYVRCNITMETDEDDLLGGFRLRDGNTVFEPGPAIVAMLRGAILLLDEVDLASAKLLCLQPIMEGKSITLKKLGVTIAPLPGFNVIATANTKGRGDETGNFIGTGLLNEAFLERFPVTVEQEYPSVAVEKKILAKHFVAAGYEMTPHSTTFFDTLARWAEAIRATFAEGGIDGTMSTRRLCHIVKAYAIFSNDPQADALAIGYCVNRFDAKTKEAFQDLYNKLAPDAAGTPDNAGKVSSVAGF